MKMADCSILVSIFLVFLASNIALLSTSWALTYEELVEGFIDEVTQLRQNPVIPEIVRNMGNVTVTRSSSTGK